MAEVAASVVEALRNGRDAEREGEEIPRNFPSYAPTTVMRATRAPAMGSTVIFHRSMI